MKQWLRSIVLLSIPVFAFACKGDPTESNDGDPVQLVATPQTVFVASGTSEAVSVQLIDERGNALPATFTATQPGSPAFTVTEDTTQRLIYDASGVLVRPRSTTSARYLIEANAFATSTFTVEAGGLTKTITVTSFPTTITAGLSSSTPPAGQLVTVTAPAGLTFASNAKITKSTTDTTTAGYVRSVSGATLTFIPIAGLDQTFAIRGVVPEYAPTLNLNVTTDNKITVGGTSTVVKQPGTDALATAPTIPALAKDQVYFLYDKPPFGFAGCTAIAALADPCNVYKVVTTVANTKLDVTLDWDNTSDLGVYVLNSTGTAIPAGSGNADAGGTGTTGHPEHGTLTFPTPGTYYIAVLRFTYAGSTVDPTYYSLKIIGL